MQPASTNVPLVIVNAARGFELDSHEAYGITASCPLCLRLRADDQAGLYQIPVAPLPNGGARAILPPEGAPAAPPPRWLQFNGSTLGELVDLVLAHLAAAHPEQLAPVPVGGVVEATEATRRALIERSGHAVNVGDTVRGGGPVTVPFAALSRDFDCCTPTAEEGRHA